MKSPVFLQLGSSNLKFELKSAVSTLIDGSKANSGFIDQKSIALINSFCTVSISHLEPLSGVKSIKSLFLKSLTTKPLLNLFNPSLSLTWKEFVSNSSALNDVICSRFSILFSRFAISRIVNLRLSRILISGSCLGLYRYGGSIIVAISIALVLLDGGTGFSADIPCITVTVSSLSITNLSILPR